MHGTGEIFHDHACTVYLWLRKGSSAQLCFFLPDILIRI